MIRVARDRSCTSALLLLVTVAGLFWMYRTYGEAPPVDAQRFHNAVQDGDLVQVRETLASGIDVNVLDDGGATPLMTAASFGRSDILSVLLSSGADSTRTGASGMTALYNAATCRTRGSDCAALLVRAGAPVDQPIQGGRTPLMIAALYGHYDTVVVLLGAGADPNAKDETGHTPLWYAACSYGDTQVLKLLLAIGCDINTTDRDGRTVLHETAYAGSSTAVAILVSAGADRLRPDNAGQTPLDVARRRADADMLAVFGTPAQPRPDQAIVAVGDAPEEPPPATDWAGDVAMECSLIE